MYWILGKTYDTTGEEWMSFDTKISFKTKEEAEIWIKEHDRDDIKYSYKYLESHTEYWKRRAKEIRENKEQNKPL